MLCKERAPEIYIRITLSVWLNTKLFMHRLHEAGQRAMTCRCLPEIPAVSFIGWGQPVGTVSLNVDAVMNFRTWQLQLLVYFFPLKFRDLRGEFWWLPLSTLWLSHIGSESSYSMEIGDKIGGYWDKLHPLSLQLILWLQKYSSSPSTNHFISSCTVCCGTQHFHWPFFPPGF